MSWTQHGTSKVQTNGNIPDVGTNAPDFTLTDNKLNDVTLKSLRGSNVVLNIFPSIDTDTCAESVRQFNRKAAGLARTTVLCISKDLPYAMKRFCAAEGINRVITLSDFRSKDFGNDYHVEMIDGSMRGLFARVVIVVDEYGVIKHSQMVPDLDDEPDYTAALEALM